MKIGELSELFQISDQMIRYYEKIGFIHPTHDQNLYRDYRVSDVYDLLTYLKYSQLNVSRGRIEKIVKSDSLSQIKTVIDSTKKEVLSSINDKQILYNYLSFLSKELSTAELNEGLFWYEQRSAVRYIDYSPTYTSQTEEFKCDNTDFTEWTKHMGICDSELIFNIDARYAINKMRWALTVSDDFAAAVNDPVFEKGRLYPPHIALVTVQKVEDDDQALKLAVKKSIGYAVGHRNILSGFVAAKVIAPFEKNHRKHYFYKIILPIKTKPQSIGILP